jgi:hypothetical protein
MDLFINNKFTCVSTAQYGEKGEEMGGHSHGATGRATTAPPPPKSKGDSSIKTISYMTDCAGPFPVKKGDYVTLRAVYDLSKHPL